MYTSVKYSRLRQGADAKTKALAAAMKRKEEYLGARVPKELKERVIARAEQLGIPVLILIRKVLEEAFESQGFRGIVGNSNASITASRSSSENAAENKFPMVLGWEEIRLNRPMTCVGCDKRLEPGMRVTMGISAPHEERIILCEICRESL